MINSDSPVATREGDKFGFDRYARLIAESIINIEGKDSIVVGIEGQWGYGKSSLLNLIYLNVKELSESKGKSILIIEFRPWWISGGSDITRAFFNKLANELEESKIAPKGVTEKIRDMGNKLSPTIPYALAALNYIFPGSESINKKMSEILEDKKTLEDIYQETRGDLDKLGKRVLIIIDDIDRLRDDEIESMLRLLKSVANLPYVTYLLVYNRQAVDEALSRTSINAGDYIEKFVQAHLPVPRISSHRIEEFIREGLREIMPGGSFYSDHGKEIFNKVICGLVASPRMAIRYLNSFKFIYASIWSRCDDADLAAIEAIRLYHPSLFNFIRNERRLLLADEPNETQRAKAFQIANGKLPKDRHVNSSELLEILFPVWRAHVDHIDFRQNEMESAGGRICNPRYFDQYFEFAITR